MSKTPPLDREAKRRLAVIRHVEEVTGNVAMSCRYFGISRQAYYIWYRRYQAEGTEGLRTRSKAPKHSPNATHVEVVGKIIYLRQNYHFGPEKIAMYLKRYTTSRSASRVCGGSSTGWTWAACRPHSDASATTADGNATRSSCPATAYRST
ncbi:leucine zipper domain-containing protein [Streptomyces sp. NPDC046994]|uniref:helix-turn-helix domain-containing protein n=1 Tax=Streptomyces sp. NPDC046994 TaxID=3155735 RepID=UPI00345358AE